MSKSDPTSAIFMEDDEVILMICFSSSKTMQHGYGYVYWYRADTDTRICHFLKKTDTWIRFNSTCKK
uniref:Uncharacterized protein n=1 Tax=Arundo donax TaxID=35708 RepID=A0A0A9FRC8_ARUDO